MREKYVDYCETYRVYGLEYNSGRHLYVISNLDLLPIKYDPLACMPEILMELVNIGTVYSRGKNISLLVQSFCNRYGLLGFKSALVEKVYDDKSVKFYTGNILGMKAATDKQLLRIFDPFYPQRNKQKHRAKIIRMQELPPHVGNEPYITHPDYCTCEAVEWYGRYGMQIYDLFLRAQTGESITLMPGNAELRYEICGGVGTRKLYFDSLKSVCDFYIMEMLTSSTPAIRLCKRCGKPLLTHGTRAEYCSASCRNVANVANSRKRKRTVSE